MTENKRKAIARQNPTQRHFVPCTWKCVFQGSGTASAYTISIPINTPTEDGAWYTVHKTYYKKSGKHYRKRIVETCHTGTFDECLAYIDDIRTHKRDYAGYNYGMRTKGATKKYDHCVSYNPDDAWSRRPESSKRRYANDNRKGTLYAAFYQTGDSPLRRAIDAHAEKVARHEACTKARTKEDILKVYGY